MNKKIKLKGEKFNFILEVNDYGFALWSSLDGTWILDASTIGNDGTFRTGWENYDFKEFDITSEKEEWSGRIEFTLKKREGNKDA